MLVRPVEHADVDQLVDLAGQSGFGLTTLPADRELLEERVLQSTRSFERVPKKPGGESYLFVLEDPATGRIAGTSGIVSKVGGFEPFYAYRVETSVHESEVLRVRTEVQTLHLVAEHSGPCEIGSLFLAPSHRRGGTGRLLSLFRFLFMAEFPRCFDPTVIAEMRGRADERGRCPFWDGLGIHFFHIDFPRADYLSLKDKRFIAELMPKHPIYIPLLPPEARNAIGRVHPDTEPALRILEKEGFRLTGMVDIFDGGPVLTCPLPEIRAVRDSRKATIAEVVSGKPESEPHIVSRPDWRFRACLSPLDVRRPGEIAVPRETADRLGLRAGDEARYAALRP